MSFNLNSQLPNVQKLVLMKSMDDTPVIISSLNAGNYEGGAGNAYINVTYNFGDEFQEVNTRLRFDDANGLEPVSEAQSYVDIMHAYANQYKLIGFSWWHLHGAVVKVNFRKNGQYNNVWPLEILSLSEDAIADLKIKLAESEDV